MPLHPQSLAETVKAVSLLGSRVSCLAGTLHTLGNIAESAADRAGLHRLAMALRETAAAIADAAKLSVA